MEDISLLSNNKALADQLALIGNYYLNAKDQYRAKTYLNASKLVADYPQEIINAGQLGLIKGIGPSVSKDVDEYLKTGQITRLTELETKFLERKKVIDYFTSIYGIGPVSANKFYDMGFRTAEDLWFKASLTEAQKIGILWEEHFKRRIERKEMVLIEEALRNILAPEHIHFEIAGSYRRGELTSGDIDVLVEQKPNLTMIKIIELLRPLLPADLATGPSKYMGVLRLKGFNGHRIDIRLIPKENYAYALLYFTGSQRFNILSRQKAIQLGYTLNEYGLYKEGVSLKAENEEDIFKYLGLKYLRPEERTNTLGQI